MQAGKWLVVTSLVVGIVEYRTARVTGFCFCISACNIKFINYTIISHVLTLKDLNFFVSNFAFR